MWPIRVCDLTTGRKRFERVIAGIVWGLALSPDGRRLVWSDGKGKLVVWDTKTDEELARLPSDAKQLCFSPDGKVLAGHSWNMSPGIHLWDAATFEEIRVLDQIEANARLLAYPTNGILVVHSGEKKELILLDVAGKRGPLRIPELNPSSIALSDDEKTLVCADDLSIRTFDRATGKPLLEFPGHRQAVFCVSVSPDGKNVASAAGWADRNVHLWDAATGKLLRSFLGHDRATCGCEVSQDCKLLVTGGSEGTLQIWDLSSGNELSRFSYGNAVPGMLALSGDCFHLTLDAKQLAAVCSVSVTQEDQFALNIWDTATGKLVRRRPFPVDYMSRPNDNGGRTARVRFHSCFSTDGVLVTEWSKMQLQVTEVTTGRARATILGDLGSPTAFSPDNRTLAAGIHKVGVDPFAPQVEAVGLFETATGKETLRLETGFILRLAFSRDGRFLATSDARGMRIWDADTGMQVFSRAWPKHLVPHPPWPPVCSLAFLPDGKRIVTGMADGTLLVWDLKQLNRERVASIPLGRDAVERLWNDLAGEDARKAHRAQAQLASSFGEFMARMKDHPPRVRPVDAKRVETLIADLSNGQFAVREAAFKELANMIDRIEPLLKQAAESHQSAEVRRRIAALLAAPYPPLTSAQLHTLRVIAVLERIDTPTAREVLRNLASGDESARETREATGALARMRCRDAVRD
jgi:WD40 repeat protein